MVVGDPEDVPAAADGSEPLPAGSCFFKAAWVLAACPGSLMVSLRPPSFGAVGAAGEGMAVEACWVARRDGGAVTRDRRGASSSFVGTNRDWFVLTTEAGSVSDGLGSAAGCAWLLRVVGAVSTCVDDSLGCGAAC